MHKLAVALSAASLIGCASMMPKTSPTPVFSEPFTAADSAEYAAYAAPGTATITGQAFLTTRGGDVKVGAGRDVILDPATRYAAEWFWYMSNASRLRLAPGALPWNKIPAAPAFAAARRTTVADGQGKFAFRNVPPGKYFVRSTVTWEIPSGSSYLPPDIQGGVVSGTVVVGPGQTGEVMLNNMVP